MYWKGDKKALRETPDQFAAHLRVLPPDRKGLLRSCNSVWRSMGAFLFFENRVCFFSFHYTLVEGDMHFFMMRFRFFSFLSQ